MAHQNTNTDKNPTGTNIENVMQLLQLLGSIQQLQAPQQRAEEAEKTREATMERLLLSLGARPKAKTELPGLSTAQTIFGRASNREALAVQDIDPEDTEKLAKARALARTENQADARLLGALAQLLADKGDISGARFAQQASETLNPPSPEQLEKRKLRARKQASRAKKAQTGGFSVTGGPRSGFAARGTPAEILAQLVATRPEGLQAKFGGFTDVGKHPTPKKTAKKKKKKRQAFDVDFPGLTPEAGGGVGPDLLGALLQDLLKQRSAPQLGA